MPETKIAPSTRMPEAVPGDEVRAQYLACSYLVSACEQAIDRMTSLTHASAGRSYVPLRALDLMRTISDDWRTALQDVARALPDEIETFTPR